MNFESLVRSVSICVPLLLASQTANAWFIIPFGLIARAFEKEPDKIEVSYSDRLAGKCAGFHVNLASNTNKSEEEKAFHSAMADKALEGVTDKEKTKELAEAYSAKWSRAAGVDISANRSYGADLVGGCRNIGVARSLAEQRETQRQEEVKRQEEIRQKAEVKMREEIRQQDEAKRREVVRLQEESDAKAKAEAETVAKAKAEAEEKAQAEAVAEKTRIAQIEAAKTLPKSLEDKLKELKQLFTKGLITKVVYDARQKELLTQQ